MRQRSQCARRSGAGWPQTVRRQPGVHWLPGAPHWGQCQCARRRSPRRTASRSRLWLTKRRCAGERSLPSDPVAATAADGGALEAHPGSVSRSVLFDGAVERTGDQRAVNGIFRLVVMARGAGGEGSGAHGGAEFCSTGAFRWDRATAPGPAQASDVGISGPWHGAARGQKEYIGGSRCVNLMGTMRTG